MRKAACYIITFTLALYGYGAPGGFTAETKKLSCIKLETLIEANEQDFAAFRIRNKLDDGANAGDVMATVAVFIVFGLIVSTWEPGAPEIFQRLQTKNKELRSRASQENCNMSPSSAPWKAVDEILNPPFGPDPVDEVSP